jgi:hypothetical protein
VLDTGFDRGYADESAEQKVVLASGRVLPPLLFVTDSKRLADNIGIAEASTVAGAIRTAGQSFCDIAGEPDPFMMVRRSLKAEHKGIVLIGGYDVVPSARTDVIGDDLRKQLDWRVKVDGDEFIVWSDDYYADRNADGVPDLPISRIPDGRTAQVVYGGLTAPLNYPANKFGVRNRARVFSDEVYQQITGSTPLLVSAPESYKQVVPDSAVSNAYLMLHGDFRDSSRFLGEGDGGVLIEAFNITNLPEQTRGVAFSGCCWSALPVQTLAKDYDAAKPLVVKPPEASVALTFLRRGGMAFIGCTGSHYSPSDAPFRYFGQPMHIAFWKYYQQGSAPAAALHKAKLEYAAAIPHGRDSLIERCIERKCLIEFTCLGLGW